MLVSVLRRLLCGTAMLMAASLIASPAWAQKTRLTVYSALEVDQINPYKAAFEAANPDVEIVWVRNWFEELRRKMEGK